MPDLAQPSNPIGRAREASPAQKAMIESVLGTYGRSAPPPSVEPSAPITPATIPAERKYIFRSRPGTVAKKRIRIPATPPPGRDETEQRYAYICDRYAKKYGSALAGFEKLVEVNGGWYVDFTTVLVRLADGKQTRECYFQTDDEDLAAFVRTQLQRDGRFYEDVPPLRVTVGGRDIDITVTNDAERAELVRAMTPPPATDDEADLEEAVVGAVQETVRDRPFVPQPVDKNGKPLKGFALTAWQRKHGLAE